MCWDKPGQAYGRDIKGLFDVDQLAISLMAAEHASQLTKGDLSALARLYEVSAARLLRFAQTLAGNREDAEDALQATMVRIAENPERLSHAHHP